MDFLYKFILVLIGTTINDVFWTLYILHVGQGNKWKASFSSSLIALTNGFIVIAFVSEVRLLIAVVIGGFLGVYFPMKWKELKDEHNNKG